MQGKRFRFILSDEYLERVLGMYDAIALVHMRSILDHVQVPDLALLEAHRVLRPGGCILVGLHVEGGKSGVISLERRVKEGITAGLGLISIDRWKDYRVRHPTHTSVCELISSDGFRIENTFWQPHWKDMACYVAAQKLDY